MNLEEVQQHLDKIHEYRRDAFALLGMAHFNHNNFILERQMVDEAIRAKDKKVVRVVKRLLSGDYAKSDISKLAELLVKHDEFMANGLATIIGFELQDKARRKEDANKI